MVLQERIELSTSPLPRECSTTELLQHLRADPMAFCPVSRKTVRDRRAVAPRTGRLVP